jgi:hypothetical protein
MKNSFIKSVKGIICILLAAFLATVFFGTEASAADGRRTADNLEEVIGGILAFKTQEAEAASVQEWIDTELSDNAGKGQAEWYVIALSRYKEDYDFSSYISALDYYTDITKITKATDSQRIALAYSAVHYNTDFIGEAVGSSIGRLGIMSYIYGLILLDSGDYNTQDLTRDEIIDRILSFRLSDGGWAVGSKTSDVDTTAMAIQALAPYYDVNRVKNAIDEALFFLSGKQLKDGDYKSFGTRSSESAAQVITALCSLGIDCRTDERFIKNGKTLLDGLLLYAREDGSFSHTIDGTSNNIATVQAMYSLIAAWRQVKGLEPFYEFSAGQLPDDITNSHPEQPSGKTSQADTVGNIPGADTINNIPGEDAADNTLEADTTDNITGTDAADQAQVSQSPAGDNNKENMDKSKKADYRRFASFLVLAVMLVLYGFLFAVKRRSRKNSLLLLALGIVALALIWGIRIQSAEEYYQTEEVNLQSDSGIVDISIRCDTVAGREAGIPEDGIILDKTEVPFQEGDTVFDVLLRIAKQYEIVLDYEGSDVNSLGTVYIKGINQLYEYDFGDLSGWMYRVNGDFPGKGCADYAVSDKDVIEWVYTCDLGKDVGKE